MAAPTIEERVSELEKKLARLLGDLLRYKEQEEAERHRGLDELVAEAQKLGMY